MATVAYLFGCGFRDVPRNQHDLCMDENLVQKVLYKMLRENDMVAKRNEQILQDELDRYYIAVPSKEWRREIKCLQCLAQKALKRLYYLYVDYLDKKNYLEVLGDAKPATQNLPEGLDGYSVEVLSKKWRQDIRSLQYLAVEAIKMLRGLSRDYVGKREHLKVLGDVKPAIKNMPKGLDEESVNVPKEVRDIGIVDIGEDLKKQIFHMERAVDRINALCKDLVYIKKPLKLKSKGSYEGLLDIRTALCVLSEVFDEDFGEIHRIEGSRILGIKKVSLPKR